MTLSELAAELGTAKHAMFVLAGRLVADFGYDAVITDRDTAEVSSVAELAIREYVTGIRRAAAAAMAGRS